MKTLVINGSPVKTGATAEVVNYIHSKLWLKKKIGFVNIIYNNAK